MTDHETDPNASDPKPNVSRRGILGGTAAVSAAALSGGAAYLNFAATGAGGDRRIAERGGQAR